MKLLKFNEMYKGELGNISRIKLTIGKTILSAAYEETECKLVVSFGVVVENEVFVDTKSMYHESNTLKEELV